MTAPRSCRLCTALGFLISTLVHAMGAALVLGLAPATTPVPEASALELDLSMFGPAAEAAAAPAAAPAIAEPPLSQTPKADPETRREPPKPEIAELDKPAVPPESSAMPNQPKSEPPKPRAVAQAPKPKPAKTPQTRDSEHEKPKPKPATRPDPSPVAERKPPVKESPPRPRKPTSDLSEHALALAEPSKPRELAKSTSQTAGKATVSASVATAGGAAASAESRASSERAYLAELQRAIARHQKFPEEARQRRVTGVSTLAFVVQADGHIGQVRVVQTSGDPALDRAAMGALAQLGTFKPIPADIGRSAWPMRVPIRFDLR